MKRIIYFGTWGRPGHFARPLRGNFTKKEIEIVETVDSPDLYEHALRNKIACVYFNLFQGLVIPYSPDDKRRGSLSAIFVENVHTPDEVLAELKNFDTELYERFKKRAIEGGILINS